MLPDRVSENATGSEAFIFSEIRDAPNSDACICFHSVGVTRHARKEYAEADFIVLCPDALFCLEVKGGKIARENGVWRIGTGDRSYTSREGPFKQAQGVMWPIIDYLKESVRRDPRNDMLIGWGVVLPDVVFEVDDPEWDREVVYDQRDRARSFGVYLERLKAHHRRRRTETGRPLPKPMPADIMQKYADALRRDFVADDSLRGLIVQGTRELRDLSGAQTRILDHALNEQNPRLFIEGGPGTGKTFIALEAARRLTAEGHDVLFLCFNRALANVLDRTEREAGSRFRITSLHRFLNETIRQAGLAEELKSEERGGAGDRLFKETYPRLFGEACERLLGEDALPHYDVLIIDEAQDILSRDYVDCLGLVLDMGMENGRWLIFLDREGQGAMYGGGDDDVVKGLRDSAAVFLLPENFRNPKKLAEEAYRLIGAPQPVCRRDLPVFVEYLTAEGPSEAAKIVKALLVKLIRERIRPCDIAVLSARRSDQSTMALGDLDIGKPLACAEAHGQDNNAVTVSSVSAFKGLESEIVILTDLPSPKENAWARSVVLVAVTRARTKAFAIVDDTFLKTRKEAVTL